MSAAHPQSELGIDALNDKFSAMVCSLELKTGDDVPFAARFNGVGVGDVRIHRYHGPSLSGGSRKSDHIAADPIDNFLFLLPLKFPFAISQARNESVIAPGYFTFISTNQPWDSAMEIPHGGLQSEFILDIPGKLLRQHVPHVDSCCAVRVATEHGAGRILKSLIQSMFEEGGTLSSAQAAQFSAMLIGALGAAALEAPELTEQAPSRSELAYARIRARALQFIAANLSEPLLDAVMVADHCHVSLRRLYAAFEASATTVGATIRQQRLERCRSDLLNPELRSMSILQVAMKWGYGCSASFARTYLAHFGRSPSEERTACPKTFVSRNPR